MSTLRNSRIRTAGVGLAALMVSSACTVVGPGAVLSPDPSTAVGQTQGQVGQDTRPGIAAGNQDLPESFDRLPLRNAPTTTPTTVRPTPTTAAPTTTTIAPATRTPGRPYGKLVPPEGVLVGGHLSVTNSYVDWDRRNDVLAYEAAIDRPLDVAHDFYQPDQPWVVERLNWYIDGGRIPMVTWRVGTNADDFLAGDYDHLIRARAQQAKQVDGMFFSRFFHEMDSVLRLDYGTDGDAGAAKFRRMWIRTRNIFAQEGVTNAVWVWSPATFRRAPGESPARYYPGDNYVDWIAVDPYLWNPCWTTEYESMETAIGWEFFEFADQHADKPIMLAEWGAGDAPGLPNRENFLRSVRTLVNDNPQIAGLIYFESDYNAPCDWRLAGDADALPVYRNLVKDPNIRVDMSRVPR